MNVQAASEPVTHSLKYITAFKELGGTGIIFRPGESSAHPISFIQNLESTMDDADVPQDKRVWL